MTQPHATAVAHGPRAVMIVGASGTGKSCLALELMALGAMLVADDKVILTNLGAEIQLSCPKVGKGLIEARGVGLLSVNCCDKAMLEFVVDLDKTVLKRLPIPETTEILGVNVPVISGGSVANLASIVWCLLKGGQILPTE